MFGNLANWGAQRVPEIINWWDSLQGGLVNPAYQNRIRNSEQWNKGLDQLDEIYNRPYTDIGFNPHQARQPQQPETRFWWDDQQQPIPRNPWQGE